MSSIIAQPTNTARQSSLMGELAPPDGSAVTEFNARMAGGSTQAAVAGTSGNLATDENLRQLLPADLQRLQEKWGNDEIGLRKEAAELCQFYEGFKNEIVMQIMRDTSARMKELEDRMRS